MTWQPLVVLPNINVQHVVETRHAALVNLSHDRIRTLWKQYPALEYFLTGFKNAFGRQEFPSVLMMPDGAPETFRTSRAVSAFRDLIALSVIPWNRANAILRRGPGWEPVFGDSFDFYPWMLGKDYRMMIAFTPAAFSMDDPKDFAGQNSPGVPSYPLDYVDEPLVEELLRRWEKRFGVEEPQWEDRALFRSLNMAFEATRMPFITAGTSYDTGRLVALWVSAFEILTHQGSGMIGKYDVLALLLGLPAGHKFELKQRHTCPTLHQWALETIYAARDDYLHGNPVADDRLKLPGTDYDLSAYSSLLYRVLLAQFLNLQLPLPPFELSTVEGQKAAGKAISDRISFERYGDKIEDALYTMCGQFPKPRRSLAGSLTTPSS